MTCKDCQWAYGQEELWCMNNRSESYGDIVSEDQERCQDMKGEEE